MTDFKPVATTLYKVICKARREQIDLKMKLRHPLLDEGLIRNWDLAACH